MVPKHPSAFACTLALLGACATAQPDAVYRAHAPVLDANAQEARAIAAAKLHPIAIPRERPQYPEQSPPPLAMREPAPPPPPVEGQASNAGDGIVVPQEPPPSIEDAPRYPAPAAGYVWAPGYWGWAGSRYSWIAGDWLAPRPGYVYVGPSWIQGRYGWEFRVGGWARAGTRVVVAPVYRHPYQLYLHPYSPYYSRRLGFYGADLQPWGSYWGRPYSYGSPWGYQRRVGSYGYSSPSYAAPSFGSRERREVHVSSPAYSAPSMRSYTVGRASGGSSVHQAVRVDGGGRGSSSRHTVHTRR